MFALIFLYVKGIKIISRVKCYNQNASECSVEPPRLATAAVCFCNWLMLTTNISWPMIGYLFTEAASSLVGKARDFMCAYISSSLEWTLFTYLRTFFFFWQHELGEHVVSLSCYSILVDWLVASRCQWDPTILHLQEGATRMSEILRGLWHEVCSLS